jgi:F-type H+-transporting ATPase subunit delta
MSEYRVTYRYARSLITLAHEQGVLEEVTEDMQKFVEICKSNRDFTLMLKNPVIRKEKKSQILKVLFEERVNQLTYSFFDIIVKKSREKFLPEIAVEYRNQYNDLMEIAMAKVTTVFALDESLREEFNGLIKRLTDKSQVELEENINKDLIGGFVLNLGDRQMDESLRGKLKELELKFS